MPQPLIDATKDLYAERIDRETWTQRITARKAYRRKIQNWAETLALAGQRPRRRTHHRRRTKPLGSWTPTGYFAPTPA